MNGRRARPSRRACLVEWHSSAPGFGTERTGEVGRVSVLLWVQVGGRLAGRGNWNGGMMFVGIGMVHGGGTTAVEYCGCGVVGAPVAGAGAVAAGLLVTGAEGT